MNYQRNKEEDYLKKVVFYDIRSDKIMNSCEFVTFISGLACSIAKDKTPEEITLLAAFFTQLGDTLATITAFNDKNC